MSDLWDVLKKIDCEECSLEDDCDKNNLCAEWITKADPEISKLRELVHKAYFTENSGTKMNKLVREMHQITHPDYWKDRPLEETRTPNQTAIKEDEG